VAVVPASSFGSKFQEHPPPLVVEVSSRSTRLYDRTRKKDVYEGFGIPAYWIVEPDRKHPELAVFQLRSGVYEQTAHVTGDEDYRAAAPFAVTIVPSALTTVG
jgi:Uma2 family endonuclease